MYRTGLALALLLSASPAASDDAVPIVLIGPFRRGDANSDGGFDITDAVGVLNYLFLGAKEPPCLITADIDDDGSKHHRPDPPPRLALPRRRVPGPTQRVRDRSGRERPRLPRRLLPVKRRDGLPSSTGSRQGSERRQRA
jgi:hypothetical protein